MGKIKNKLAYFRKKADKAIQEYFREQELPCEGCGNPATCMHHYFPKSMASALRYDENNLVATCPGCHFSHHNGNPNLHAKVLAKRGQEWHNDLLSRKEIITKPNQSYYKEMIEKYT